MRKDGGGNALDFLTEASTQARQRARSKRLPRRLPAQLEAGTPASWMVRRNPAQTGKDTAGGDRPDLTGISLFYAPGNLLLPGGLRTRIGVRVNAAEEVMRQGDTLVRRQDEGVSGKRLESGSHGGTITFGDTVSGRLLAGPLTASPERPPG